MDQAIQLRRRMSRTNEKPLAIAVMGFQAACMLLLAFKDPSVDWFSIRMAVLLPLGTLAGLWLTSKCCADRCMFLLTAFLCSLSVILLRAVFSTTGRAAQQAKYLGLSIPVMFFGVLLPRFFTGREEKFIGFAMLFGVCFMLSPFAFHTSSAARSWIRVLGHQMQPSELMKPATVFILASCFTQGRRASDWGGGVFFGALNCLILFVQKDLGAMLLYFLLTAAMFAAGTGRWKLTLGAVGAAAGLAVIFVVFVAGKIDGFGYLITRIEIWKNPWSGAHESSRQIVQGLMSIVSGGLFGAGLGLSSARKVAVVASDYIFAAVSEEFGIVFALCVLAVFMVLLIRGMGAAGSARSRFHALVAFGACFELTVQMLLIVCGNLHIVPLTGVTLPFVSEGGSSLMGSMLLMGMMMGVSAVNARDEYDDLMQASGGREVDPE
jgi:cell division protein FtsW (lipid II flippase)